MALMGMVAIAVVVAVVVMVGGGIGDGAYGNSGNDGLWW